MKFINPVLRSGPTVLLLLLPVILSGCSYIMDFAERSISRKASFSLEASYNPFARTVTLTWDSTDSDGDFAGYEVYITEAPDDEYAGYVLRASRFSRNIDLDHSGTDSYVDDVSPAGGYPVSHGIYFYRVGIIYWDDSEDERTSKKGYDVPWDAPGNIENNYNGRTEIEEISGYAMVTVP